MELRCIFLDMAKRPKLELGYSTQNADKISNKNACQKIANVI
jgi:hypothetical protein